MAERLAKLDAWKKKHEQKQRMEQDANAASTRKLFAEMDQKASGTPAAAASPPQGTPALGSPATPQSVREASPAAYAGKFDPKAIAKSAHRRHSPTRLGSIKGVRTEKVPVPAQNASKASALPTGKPISRFGFQKASESDKLVPSKRKLDLGDEETSKRTLAKLPDLALEDADSVPYNNQEEEQDDDDVDGNFAGTEEEAAAAARAAHERREERIQQQSVAMQVDPVEATEEGEPAVNGDPVSPVAVAAAVPEPAPELMEVDDDVDPLDAFMADLGNPGSAADKPEGSRGEMLYNDDQVPTDSKAAGDSSSALTMSKRSSKKDIPTIDYSKLDLPPARKNFWVEPQGLKDLTEAEVTELRAELDGIKVSGQAVPKPVQKWHHCGLVQSVLEVVGQLGYDSLTPIQMQAIPAIMSGRDLVGIAKTGSGKTMAFLIPMFRHVMEQDRGNHSGSPVGLILTPTRELAVQIHQDCKPFAKALGLRSVCAYGGSPIKDQIADLKRGADIVIATPGRMIDLLSANQGRVVSLMRTTYIVLDEADRMFDMGFEPQVLKILGNIRSDSQRVVFSATMPRLMESLVKKVLRNQVEITVGGKSIVAPEITQMVEVIEEKDKFVRLLELLGNLYVDDDDVRALIFVERQEKADDLLRELLRKGYGCMSIHGGKDQADRDSTIIDFKSGVCPVLVATSVVARGLDVKQLKLVVNYDAPNHQEDYVHRCGRTGRAGNTGTAVTFVTEEQENCAAGIVKALTESKQPIPERLGEMLQAWKAKVKSGKAKEWSGFSGQGLEKLDKDREATRMRERQAYKAEGEEDEVEEEKSPADTSKTKAATVAVETAASAIVSRDATKDAVAAPAAAVVTAAAGSKSPNGGALEKAASAVSDINARLAKAGQLRHGQPIDNKGPDAGAFHATLEINDFPQKARWAVTNRTNVAKILEATGTSITTKGTFYALGKEPPPGAEPKLYILVEGDTEVVVSSALTELTRLLKEGTVAAQQTESRGPTRGRYTIT